MRLQEHNYYTLMIRSVVYTHGKTPSIKLEVVLTISTEDTNTGSLTCTCLTDMKCDRICKTRHFPDLLILC